MKNLAELIRDHFDEFCWWPYHFGIEARPYVIKIWVEGLQIFTPEIVSAAFAEWRRNNPGRPKGPHQIRKLILELSDAQMRQKWDEIWDRIDEWEQT